MIRWLGAFSATNVDPAWIFTSGCSGQRVYWREDGYIEVEGQDVPKMKLPTDGAPGFFTTIPGQKPEPQGLQQHKAVIWKHSNRTGVPAALIAAFIVNESRGQANAINPEGSADPNDDGVGLMQITSSALKRGLSREQLINPDLNVEIGSDYLLSLSQKYNGNPLKIAAAYNAGSPMCGAYGACQPNVWALKTNCPKGTTGPTPDYPGNIIRAANAAMDVGFAPQDNPAKSSPCDPCVAPQNCSVLRVGSLGPGVEQWQNVLLRDAAISGYPYSADGNFGPGTDAATKLWQQAKGITPDGIVGEMTWRASCGTSAPIAVDDNLPRTYPQPAQPKPVYAGMTGGSSDNTVLWLVLGSAVAAAIYAYTKKPQPF